MAGMKKENTPPLVKAKTQEEATTSPRKKVSKCAENSTMESVSSRRKSSCEMAREITNTPEDASNFLK